MSDLVLQTGSANKILRTKSKLVLSFDRKLKKIITTMQQIMQQKKGIGLAAPQVGINIRVVVMDFSTPKKVFSLALINPKIIQKSQETTESSEGCLSLPDQSFVVSRAKVVLVEFQDPTGIKKILEFQEMNARVIQHEIDHLNGVLICDKEKTNSKLAT